MAKPSNPSAQTLAEIIHQDVVTQVQQELPAVDTSVKLAELFKLFGDSTRLRLLQCLLVHEMCGLDLAATLGVSKSCISHHLRALKIANLVRFRREGQIIFYDLADDHVKQILAMGLEHIIEPQ
ncbi:MAG: winged helix-turn-helix transcriptional regulator [Desulfovibrionaceae bacterium]|nr:winged helix-turn-helix transcriptional regulator [Desulfovibrionaceae bacterium]